MSKKHLFRAHAAAPGSRRSVRFAAGAVLTAAALAVTACSSEGGEGGGGGSSEEVVVKVGFALPLTGVISGTGVSQQEGARLAVEEANESGYLGEGVTIELVEQDTKGDPAETISATEKLLSSGVVAIVGGTTTSEAGVIKPRTSSAGVPLVLLSTLDPSMAESPYAFRQIPLASSPDGANSQAAQALAAEGLKTAYVAWTTDNDGQKADAESWMAELEKNGVEIVGTSGANTGDSNFAGPAAQIVDADPDLVVISFLPGQDAGFVKALRDRGYSGKIASYQSLATQAAYDLAGDTLDGAVVASIFQPQASFDATRSFVANFEAKYDRAPHIQNAIGYAAATLLIEGMKNASDVTDGASITAALEAITTRDTVYGPVRMENGQAYVDGELPLAVWEPGGVINAWR